MKYKTAFVTSLPVTKANVVEIAGSGRATWKIENESFDVLKNHGYELEHSLPSWGDLSGDDARRPNMLAFAWRTGSTFRARVAQGQRRAEKGMRFFAYLATLASFVVFPDWADLSEALATFTIPPALLATSNIE